jgi:hypothetical protein
MKNAVFWDVAPGRSCGLRYRFNPEDLHGTTSQKTAIFIVTTVKTSNLTSLLHVSAV